MIAMSPNHRPWIDALDAGCRRRGRVMLATSVAWVALALGQALGIAWLWRTAWDVVIPPPHVALPLRDTVSGVGCTTYPIDGLLSRPWAWAAVVLLPWALVAPRRSGAEPRGPTAAPASPYRGRWLAPPRTPDLRARLRSRRARRAMVAAAGASWLLIDAFWQPVIIGPRPFYVRINGVALLDLLVAILTVLAHVALAAAATSPPRPPPA